MFRFAYNALLSALVPIAVPYLALHPRYRSLLARFSPGRPIPLNDGAIWVHAASLGEVNTARPVVRALRERYTDVPILLTTSTVTGMEQAQTFEELESVAWFPFDHPICVTSFFERMKPRYLVLIETELWPNVLQCARKCSVPVVLINGRLSEKHFSRNQRIGGLLRPALGAIDLACMQGELDAERLGVLGVRSDGIHVTGNTKFDGVKCEVDSQALATLREECGIDADASVLVFGSTRPGEESIALACWLAVRESVPGLRLVIAPRHVQRSAEVRELLREWPLVLRSACGKCDAVGSDDTVVVVDTVGELVNFYGLANVAVVGGSFSEDVQGHNPIEPTALGVATVFGPHIKNFLVPARTLVDSGGAVQVEDQTALIHVVRDLLRDEERRLAMGVAGCRTVAENAGAIERSLVLLDGMMGRE